MTAAAASKISVRGLQKSFGRNRVLDGIDFYARGAKTS